MVSDKGSARPQFSSISLVGLSTQHPSKRGNSLALFYFKHETVYIRTNKVIKIKYNNNTKIFNLREDLAASPLFDFGTPFLTNYQTRPHQTRYTPGFMGYVVLVIY